MQIRAKHQALKIAAGYMIVAGCWILFSDELVKALVNDPDLRTRLSIVKGWGFVVVTGGLLYLFIWRLLRSWAEEVKQREAAEVELNRSRAYYQHLMETASDGIHVLNEDGELIEASPSFYRMLGYSPENPPHLKVSDWDAQWLGGEFKERIARLLDHPAIFETRHRCRDGSVIFVEINARGIEIDGRRCLYASSRDVTSRRLAEVALRESEAKFSRMFNASGAAVALTTMKEGRYLDANEEFLKMVRRPREEVIGHTSTEINLWVNPGQRAELVRRLEEHGRIRNVDVPLRNSAGEIRHVLWSAEVILIGGERCLLGTSLDITERREAEQKQHESEALYRRLFELESDAILLADQETHVVIDVNQSAQELYGYSRDEFLRLRLEEVSAEPEQSVRSLETDERRVPLRWHRKKSGERFAVEITATAFEFAGRRLKLGVVRDITARIKVEQALRETEDRFHQLADNITDVFWIASPDLGTVHYVSPGYRVVWGRTPESLYARPHEWEEAVLPGERDRVLECFNSLRTGNTAVSIEYRIARPDGSIRWVLDRGFQVRDAAGAVIRVIGVASDITERKEAEHQIQLQFSAMAAAANAIVITDRRGTIEWVNPAFTRLTGYEAAEAVGQTGRLLKSGQHGREFYADLWRTILAGGVWHGEIVNRRKTGELYAEDMTITPVPGTDGAIAHFVAIKQDVTEQHQLQKRIQQGQKMEAIGTLAGGIAHDFNNILAAMFGFAQLVQQDTGGNPAAQEGIAQIIKAVKRAKDLVQQILTFSRQREQKAQVIRLESVVNEAMKFLRASLPANIEIFTNFNPVTPSVLADPTQIYQVVLNLATNALHAVGEKAGRLTLALDPFQPDENFLRLHPEMRPAPYARLAVSDTGHGMDAKTMERIFEPFFTTKPVGNGTGLGLAVVHGIVQSHNGCITVESEVGRGTTFTLYFPGQLAAPVAADRADVRAPGGRGQRILVLDDEPSITLPMQRLLTRMNFVVTVTNRAREALEWCRENPERFDLVITDLTMPEMNGMEVARRLRAIRSDLPVVLSSGVTPDLDRAAMDAAGIFELIEKPVSVDALAAVLQRAFAAGAGRAGKR